LLPFKRKKEAEDLFANAGIYIGKEIIIRPVASNPPFRIMIKAGFKQREKSEMEVSICTEPKIYSPFFTALLGDFYLYL